MTTRLIYIGRGAAIPGVPAQDLTDEDFKERAEQWAGLGIDEAALLKSGLYELAIKTAEPISDETGIEQPILTSKPKKKAAKDGE